MSLLKPGICQAFTDNVSEKLKEVNIRTVTDFITEDPEELSQKCGIPFHASTIITMIMIMIA